MKTRHVLLTIALGSLLATSGWATIIWEPDDQTMNTTATIGAIPGGPYTDDVLYIGFDAVWPSGAVGSNEFYVLWFDADSSQNIGIKGDQGPGGTDYLVRHRSSDSGAYSPTQATVPSTVRMVGLLEKTVSGAGQPYDRFSVWVNPASPVSPSPAVTTNHGGDTSLTTLGKRVANNNDPVLFQNIVLATTFEEAAQIAVIPPSTYVAADFNDLALGQLQGQAGGTGLVGQWSGSNQPSVYSGDLTSPLYPKTQPGTPQHLSHSATNPRHEFRSLFTPMTDEVWLSVLLSNTAASGRSGLSLNPPTVTPFDDQGTVFIELRGTDFAYDFGTGSETIIPSVAATDETLLVLIQMALNGGGAVDDVRLWLDPDLTDGTLGNDTPSVVQTDVHFLDALNHFGAFVYNGSSNVDAIYISNGETAFTDVTGVELPEQLIPEPASLALLGLGALALRRRRGVN